MNTGSRKLWALIVTSVALFMVVLDNLVVTTAIPVIRADFGSSIEDLQWTVNAYTLSFAVLLLTGAALGDRFGRRRMLVIGLGVFSVASAAAALAPSLGALIAARAVQGAGGAMVMPLTLTLLSEAFPVEGRGVAIGIWSGIAGLAVAIGPLVGGAVVEGIDWHWIFWLNVPIGAALMAIAPGRLVESHGPAGRLDLRGVGLVSAGLFGIVYGLVRGEADGWASASILTSLVLGAIVLAVFVWWELRAPAPMLPMGFFRSRTFSAANSVSLLMYFGMFGAIFLLAQFLQTVQGYSPLGAGVRTLPWTGMIMLFAPLAGLVSGRIGGRPLLVAGMALQAIALAWLAAVTTPTVAYGALVLPFILSGVGMALVFPPVAELVLGSVRPQEAGQASGANTAIREVGGVLGVAVLASVFSASGGSYASGQAYTDGLVSATWVGAAVVAVGVIAAALVPGLRRLAAPEGAPAALDAR